MEITAKCYKHLKTCQAYTENETLGPMTAEAHFYVLSWKGQSY